jgi:hypothetical protein
MRLVETATETAGWMLGQGLGLGLALGTFAGSALRGARIFHPEGELYEASVEPAGEGAAAQLGERLAGRALVRLSTGLRRGHDAHRDVLGLAIRFAWDPDAPESAAQDLLLVTARHVATLPLALLITDTSSYLANDYYSIARFRAGELGVVELRAAPRREPSAAAPATRSVRLACAVAEERAVFHLQARGDDGAWQPFANLSLTGPSPADDAELLFSPHHAALGLEPVGFLNALRRAPYPASRAGRTRAARAAAGGGRRRARDAAGTRPAAVIPLRSSR